ncbi:MFS transporter [Streptomyces iconiensis]|uniref:MFS transporter n=1 Tax=Streptomyces iconiensis TaxID=1384038 RepID=A0ABT6ZNS7_9ACTN|nr:MFS transporter [Streptomyces iconiensis]MDJ1130694.1 MFS transporter [Streptomyces iconiensis]
MRAYLTTAVLARFADEGVAIALALLALDRTGSAALGAFVLTAWMAPHAVAAPLAGALAERARRPRLFYGCALALFAACLALLGLTVGTAPPALALTFALVGGCCGPVVTGGLSSLLAGLAQEPTARARVYALDAATYNAASVTAPAAVAALATAFTPALATGVLAAAAAGAALLAPALPTPHEVPGHTPVQPGSTPAREGQGAAPAPVPLRTRLATGLAALWRVRQLRAITAATSVAFLGIGALPVIAVLLAGRRGEADGGGLLMTAFALGALGGAVALARRPPRLDPARLATLSLLVTGAALAGAALAPSFPLAVALFALAGVGDGPLLSTTLRIRADHAPEEAHTQVFTLGAGLKQTAAAGGAALVGALSGTHPGPLLLAVAALQIAAALLLRLLGRAPRHRSAPDRVMTGA